MKTKTASKPLLMLLRLGQLLWVRVALMAVLAVVASATAIFFENTIPDTLTQRFTPDAVMPILTILASSMLAVSTFSLNVMVSAHNAAAAQATPRVHRILLADTTTQTVLATFIGAFVYALTSIILFKAQLHGPGAAVTVLAFTVVVVVLVILAMLRWIDHLSDLSSMETSLRATERAARDSLIHTKSEPALRALPLTPDTVIPDDAQPIGAPRSGFLQFIDLPRLSAALGKSQARVYIHSEPGTNVLQGQPIAYAAGLSDALLKKIQACLTIGDTRTFEQDATYGLLVLSEIGSRALSPGVNDPGTAIDVIARQQGLLWDWVHTPLNDAPPKFDRIFVPDTHPKDLIDKAYGSIARDGAGTLEVVQHLLAALEPLTTCPDKALAQAARDMANRARAYADKALPLVSEKASLRRPDDAAGG